jgi:hypothetical protein
MSDKPKSYTEKFKENQKRLKDRSKELFNESSNSCSEPQFTGDPTKIFEKDEEDENKD